MFNCNIYLFMNKKIITGFLMFALAVFSMSSFVACKDYDEDSYDDLKARINKQITLTEALENQIKALQEQISKIKSCTCDPSKYASQEEFEKALKRIADLEEAIKNIKSCTCQGGGGGDTTIYITNPYDDEWIKVKFNEIEGQLTILNTLNAWQVYIENRIDSIATAIYGWDTTIYNLNHKVDSILQVLEGHTHTDTIYISGGGCDEGCAEKIAKAQRTANDALYFAQQALLLAQEALDKANAADGKAQQALDKANDADNKAQQALDKANENAGRIDGHETRIKALEDALKDLVTKDELKEEIKKLNDRIDNILNRMVTGVIIQGTECPVIGYFNTPLDIRSQLLAAYYGEVTATVEFPTTSTADYVDVSERWTTRNLQVIGSFPTIISISDKFVGQKNGSETGNAGTLYMTVNPAEVDYEGQTVTLESSTGNAAGITLSPLKRSDRELTFGYTRAANNGFYEAAATLTVGNIENAKVRINYKDLEDEAKAMLKQKTKNSVLGFGAALLSSMQDIMPAYAIKTTWTAPSRTDAVGEQTYSVYSQYGLGAAAIKPFSFAFLKDLNVNLPGETKIQNLIGKIIDKLKIQLNLNLPDFSQWEGLINFKNINLDRWRNGEGKIIVDVQGILVDPNTGKAVYVLTTNQAGQLEWVYLSSGDQEAYYYDENGDFHWAESGLTIEFQQVVVDADADMTAILEDIARQIDDQYGESSTLVDLLNAVVEMGDLNAKLNDAIVDVKNDIKSQLQGYVTKAYNKLNSIFSKAPNRALQPILIAKDGKKIGILSKAKNNPTKVSSTSLELVPTSYTLELFAPAYKKYIVVSDVFNADGTEADASIGRAANGENMGQVIDSEKTCTINGQHGYIYEISYNAVDYHGKIVNKRFYVQF